MPNFALVRPVGGQPRSINDYIQENAQRRSADMSMQAQEMQLQEGVQRQSDRATLRDIVARSGGNWDQASQEAAAAGVSPEAVMSLQDRARGDKDYTSKEKDRARSDTDYQRKEALARLEVGEKIADMARGVTDQASHDEYRMKADELARPFGMSSNVPEQYDPEFYKRVIKSADEKRLKFRMLTDEEERRMGLPTEGAWGLDKDGKPHNLTESKGKRSIKEYADPASPTGTRWGYEDDVVGKPGKGNIGASGGTGRDPAKVATAEKIMANIPGVSWEEAYNMANSSSVNPVKFATEMIRLEQGGGLTADAMKPEDIQARLKYWTENIPGRAPAATNNDPLGIR